MLKTSFGFFFFPLFLLKIGEEKKCIHKIFRFNGSIIIILFFLSHDFVSPSSCPSRKMSLSLSVEKEEKKRRNEKKNYVYIYIYISTDVKKNWVRHEMRKICCSCRKRHICSIKTWSRALTLRFMIHFFASSQWDRCKERATHMMNQICI